MNKKSYFLIAIGICFLTISCENLNGRKTAASTQKLELETEFKEVGKIHNSMLENILRFYNY